MGLNLTQEDWAWLEQYEGLDLPAPVPPPHVRVKLESLGLIRLKGPGLGATPKGMKLLRSRAVS